MVPDLVAVGIAKSPVTDCRLYDTIDIERYMGLLPDNFAGYDSSAASEGRRRPGREHPSLRAAVPAFFTASSDTTP